MDLLDFLPLFAGIGLFLHGMNMLSTAIEQLAGARLEQLLERLTSNKWKGLALGTGVTAIIQSSAATTVTVIGFLNAEIMKLPQALPVIFGANIGSCATAQILRLGDLQGAGVLLNLLKPSSFAPVLIFLGAAILLVAKKEQTKNIANLLLGFGILFWGMTLMEETLSPLRDVPAFQELFVTFENPIIALLVGAGLTALIQSSSASVGILQALSSTGTVTFSIAFPMILGQNIGKCLTVILASIGTNRDSKRACAIHVFFNVFGAVLFLCVMYGLQSIFHFAFFDEVVNRGDIANIHTAFNLITALILMPAVNLLVKLSDHLIRKDPSVKTNPSLDYLDDIFLKTPSIALEQCTKVLNSMGDAIRENFDIAESLLLDGEAPRKRALMNENEHFLDKCEAQLGEYLVKITRKSLTEQESHLASEILQCVSEYERIGDYCVNIAETAQYMSENRTSFSEEAAADARTLFSAVRTIVDKALRAFAEEDPETIVSVEPMEEVIDGLIMSLRNRHLKRLQDGTCSISPGISYVELLNHMERISDHCSNVAIYIIQKQKVDENFDRHAYLSEVHKGTLAGYQARYDRYYQQFVAPLASSSHTHKEESACPEEDL